ncbi:NAD(P)H-dependent flavin oxidoreductase YrpB (nitropropane dioxygenase family) [Paraburkholderia sp. EB58]|jgi:hypothetical protein
MNFSFHSEDLLARLAITVPIVQAPMSGWATPSLQRKCALCS